MGNVLHVTLATTDDPTLLRAVLDLSPDMIVLSEFSGAVRYINPAGRSLVGLDDEIEQVARTTVEFFTPAGLQVSGRAEEALKSQKHWRGRTELRHFRTGEPIPVALSTFVIQGETDQPSMIATIIHDRRHDDQRDQLIRTAADLATHAAAEHKAVSHLSRLALDGGLAHLQDAATTAAATILGVDKCLIARMGGDGEADLELEAISGLRDEDIEIKIPISKGSFIGHVAHRGEAVVCVDAETEQRFSTSAMMSYGMHSVVGVPISGATGTWGALCVMSERPRAYSDSDVSFLQSVAAVLSTAVRRHDLDRQLRERSLLDSLTGLANRELAYERIDAALARARIDGTCVAVLLLDIDDFKIINDSLGHDAGDVALVRFAQRLKSTMRGTDTVARLGGDEFVIICEGMGDMFNAQELANRIADAIGQPDPGAPTPLSASIGIAVSEPASTRRDLIHRADLAMYRAKDAGPGTHAVFDDTDMYDAERIRTLSVDLRSALTYNELSLHYQPIVDIESGDIVGMEALARWEHRTLGAIGPAEFVSIADRTGLALPLGHWALRTACAQAAEWRTFGNVEIRVNVSALQLRSSAFASDVADVLRSTGLAPEALGLEITETVWVADTSRVAETLTQLHAMGVKILLDNMGRGDSSIAHLSRYRVFDCFKIDREYIAALPGTQPEAIVSAIVSIARAFGVTVVGEGVETSEQLDALRQCGCDMAQGFYLGRPVTAEDVEGRLRRS